MGCLGGRCGSGRSIARVQRRLPTKQPRREGEPKRKVNSETSTGARSAARSASRPACARYSSCVTLSPIFRNMLHSQFRFRSESVKRNMRRLNSILAPPALGIESPGVVRRGALAFALLLLLAVVGITLTTARAQNSPRPAAPDAGSEASYGPRSPEVKALEAFLTGKTPPRLERPHPVA